MNILEYLAERRVRKLFPQRKDDFWYCWEFNEYQHQQMKQEKPWKSSELELPCEVFLVNPFKNYDRIKEGSILPCIKLEGWIGYYQITKHWRYSSAGSDFASWDDGFNVNLKLHHCERAV